jgi:hypothetical protein
MLVYPRAPYFVLPYISCAGSVRLEFVSCLIVRSSGLKRFSYSWRGPMVRILPDTSVTHSHGIPFDACGRPTV